MFSSPLLDIERRLLKLEKVAVLYSAKRGKKIKNKKLKIKKKLSKAPLILFIDSLHLL